jgi:cytochrome c oxidase accessory protein FixG
MALTIEIDHAKTPARKVAAAGTTTKVVPQSVKGRIRRLKWVILVLALGVYYIAPFLRWDRGPGEPNQAILLDFEHGRLYGFFIEIWPQELYFVTGLMILAAAVLILANALAGRVWCGFACPQTVWTDLFLLVERLIEGDRRDRLKKMNAPLTVRRIAEIGAKHAIWLLISFGTGGALVFYFTDAPTLVVDIVHGQASLSAWTWITVFAGTTYGLAGFARDQVCTFMCPWPRLQGAIWDPEAYTVNYRDYRSEQRTSAKKAIELRSRGENAGDCVACNMCVTVCPIGIDIREGPNFACINCGLCVDACDNVMETLSRPRGLIDFESWNNIERERKGEARVSRLIRPKTVVLAGACVAMAAGMAIMFANRTSGAITVQHDRSPVAVRLSDGSIRNAYTIKLMNKSATPRAFQLKAEGADVTVVIVGTEAGKPVNVPADGSASVRITLTMVHPQNADIRFVAKDVAGTEMLSAVDRFVVQ